ncbi:nucleoside hydrolase-like [Anopheles ziemanni]|uniref:nucleoside hydrolase-like n=1 Tax=Anopheles coustani TaxID=139045 RepID=UPI002659F53E|nr:nucleoside hydrolase-like [Anopheles coustani]XP_058126848.1 nucleoside hydrolase-like [Anopheles coustani]XP_058176040.1 nucleoside hydrolase-like [Anopheles ziemanni]
MAQTENRRKVIIDLDAGTDDAWALLMLLRGEQRYGYEVIAITCVHGNTNVDDVTINVLRVLTAIGRTDIPVFKGAREPFITSPVPRTSYFHGVNGFGDIAFEQQIDLGLVKPGHAAPELYRLLAAHGGRVALIFVGPLTNLALCIKLHPEVLELLGADGLYVMGGNRHGVGNTTRSAEFNFYADPEAAHIVFQRVPPSCPITVLPWETCLTQAPALPMAWRLDVLGGGPSVNEAVGMLNAIERKLYGERPNWMPCDAFLVAVFVDPSIVERSEWFHVEIELHGAITRGQMVLDHLKARNAAKPVEGKPKENVRIIDRINDDSFRQLCLMAAL